MKSLWFPLLAFSRAQAGWAAVITLVLASMAAGCIGLEQYHVKAPGEAGSPRDLECCVGKSDVPSRDGWKCADAYLENREEYLLGFAEFDDLGWAWDKQQQSHLISAIDREIAERDALIVVFAHGWKHNATTCDNNVTCFRATLEQLYQAEKALQRDGEARRIIGVYIGWRGDTARGKLLRQTTFFGRKGTAHQVGSGAVTELLVRLKELRAKAHRERGRQSDTRLVIVGHSFGGALIFSATSQLMVERMAISAAREDRVQGFADLIVLVNPAFEAALYQPLHRAVLDRAAAGGFVPGQKPVFVIVTARGDTATSKAFPAGRFFAANFLDDYRTGEEGRTQKKANKTAVGHFDPYRTHTLEKNANTPPRSTANKALDKDCICPFEFDGKGLMSHTEVANNLNRLRGHNFEKDPTLDFPTSRLIWETGKGKDQTPHNSPLMVIRTEPEIIARHIDIYQPAFVDFLSYQIMLASDESEFLYIASAPPGVGGAAARAPETGEDVSPAEYCEPDEGP